MAITAPAEAASLPQPPAALISRVARGSDLAWFYWSGRESVRELEATLALVGRSLNSFESILDFGCGCGRMLLWMEDVGTTCRLHGADVDTEVIAWCRTNIPYASFHVNDPDPPLPFADGEFDLVFNRSVFTHLDERHQDLWLTELQRVTRAGGLIVLSTQGEHAIPDGAWQLRDGLEHAGIVVLDETVPGDLGYPDWYRDTWHAPWYVFEHWGRWFDIRAYLPDGALGTQDQVLLERRPDHDTPRMPLAARPPLPAAGTPAKRVADALATARSQRSSGDSASSRPWSPRAWARRLVLRALRPYIFHEDNIDAAVATSIAELTRVTDRHTAVLEGLEGERDAAGQ